MARIRPTADSNDPGTGSEAASGRPKLIAYATPAAHAAVKAEEERTGLKMVEIFSRTVNWFFTMPADFRSAIYREDDLERRRELLERWVHQEIGKAVVRDVARATSTELGRYERLGQKLRETSAVLSEILREMQELEPAVRGKKKG